MTTNSPKINQLRAILIKIQDCLSNDDRQRLHFFLGPSVSRRIRDDISLNGTLNLIEALFERDQINEQDFTFLINAFESIRCYDAVQILKDYQLQLQPNMQSILTEEQQEDKYARENHHTVVDVYKTNTKIVTCDENNHTTMNLQSMTIIEPEKSSRMQLNHLVRIGKIGLFICTFFLIIGLIVSTSINAKKLVILKEKLQIKDATIINDQIIINNYSEINLRLINDLSLFRQTMGTSNVSFILKAARSTLNGTTLIGKNGQGDGLDQLSNPFYMTVDDDQTIYVSDQYNSRVIMWKSNATKGELVAGGNGIGMSLNQLNYPGGIVIDKKTNTLIIADFRNQRVVRWPREKGTQGEVIISGVDCWDIALDSLGNIYIADATNHEIKRWTQGATEGVLIAGGNGAGFGLNQLNQPRYIYIDQNDTIYISDCANHRVLKLIRDTQQVVIVAGGRGSGSSLLQLNYPMGIVTDYSGRLYIADTINNRVIRWLPDTVQGEVIVGGNGKGRKSNQLNQVADLSFDGYGNLYVLEFMNNRLQMFSFDQLN